MRTLSSKRTRVIWKKSESPKAQVTREKSAPLIGRGKPVPVRANLLESEEYEWISSLNMPGLIASARPTEQAIPRIVPKERHGAGEIIETEDGDTTSACQLPGGLLVDQTRSVFVDTLPRHSHELQCEDEYSEAAAMQMPGRLANCATEAPAGEPSPMRGLCTTCIHNPNCDFPRPVGGVWRCEEYA